MALAACCASFSCAAHEFWLWPEPFNPQAGGSVRLTLRVGEYFTGDLAGFTPAHAAALRRYGAGASEDLLARGQVKTPRADVRLASLGAGTTMVAFDSATTLITLPADKFHAYLHDEGLDHVVRQREAGGTAQMPGRERFRRNVKTLLRVGGKSDQTYAVRTGQRLEIVPTVDPLALGRGERLKLALLFDGQALPNHLAKAWHKRDGQTVMIRAFSDPAGNVVFDLPYAGPWMISVVQMIPAADTAEAEWDSFWGNLTFELRG
jgi:hypothetical protein